MEFRVLGSLEVFVAGQPVNIGRARERKLLAALLANAGRPVSVDRLVDAMWGDDLPGKPEAALQTAVSRLRKTLAQGGADHGIRTGNGFYLIDLGDNTLDSEILVNLVDAAESADTEAAAVMLRDALQLVRGPPYAEFEYDEFAQAEIRRLNEVHHTAAERRISIDLEMGRHQEMIPEVKAALSLNPLDEKLWGHLMVALYRCGRQADALRAFRDARTTLVDELGIDPSPFLVRLEERILSQDPSLDGEAAPEPSPDVAPEEPAPASDLPAPPSGMVGRREELDNVLDRLGRSRLVSIVGPPGVGKSRLALDVAWQVESDFTNGAAWVSLDSDLGGASFEEACVAALGVQVGTDGARSRLFDWARHREQLLVFDGCEAAMPAATPAISSLLEKCRGLKVLVTSRQRLGVAAETVEWLNPLELPASDADEEAEAAAIELFVRRASDHTPAFSLDAGTLDAVRTIVSKVDGLPLGIELAAGELVDKSVHEVAEELDTGTATLATRHHDAPDRHRSLESAIESSWRRLSPEAAITLTAMSHFKGPWTVDDAEAMLAARFEPGTATQMVHNLANRSLLKPVVRAGPHSRAAFTMLEVLRRHARRRLDELGLRDEMTGQHARVCAAVAASLADALRAGKQYETRTLLDRHPDLMAAHDWLLTHDREKALTMTLDLSDANAATQSFSVTEEVCAKAVSRMELRGANLGQVLQRLAFSRDTGTDLGEENIRFSHPARAWRNRRRHPPDWDDRLSQADAEFERAIAAFEEAGDNDSIPDARIWQGWVKGQLGDYRGAMSLVTSALSADSLSPRGMGSGRLLLANLAIALRDDERAKAELDALDAVGERFPPNARVYLFDTRARLARANQRTAEAFHLYRRALTEVAQPHDLPVGAILAYELAFLSLALQDEPESLRYFALALEIGRRHGMPRIEPTVRAGLAQIEMAKGHAEEAMEYLNLAAGAFEELGDASGQAYVMASRAAIAENVGDYRAAAAYAMRGVAALRRIRDPVHSAMLLDRVALSSARRGGYHEAAQLLGAADAARHSVRIWRDDADPVAELFVALRGQLGRAWDDAYGRGRGMGLAAALELAASLGTVW